VRVGGTDEHAVQPPRARGWALAGLVLLLLLALFYVFGAISDLVADAGSGIPVDHLGAFTALAGSTFDHTKVAAPGTASYVTMLERGYALHELTFALMFIVILVIPFRRRRRWAWWAAWILMIANLGYLHLRHPRPRDPEPQPHRRHRPTGLAPRAHPRLLRPWPSAVRRRRDLTRRDLTAATHTEFQIAIVLRRPRVGSDASGHRSEPAGHRLASSLD